MPAALTCSSWTRLGDLLADRLKNLQALQLAGSVEQEGDRLFEQSRKLPPLDHERAAAVVFIRHCAGVFQRHQ